MSEGYISSQSPVGSSPDLDKYDNCRQVGQKSLSQSPVGSSPDLDKETKAVIHTDAGDESQSPVGSSPDLDTRFSGATPPEELARHNRLSARVLIWTPQHDRRLCRRGPCGHNRLSARVLIWTQKDTYYIVSGLVAGHNRLSARVLIWTPESRTPLTPARSRVTIACRLES